jgi:putative ABC transport system permease protein
MHNIFVDFDFIDTYNIKMAAGRKFNQEFAQDVGKAFIINESALKAFGWRTAGEALGKHLSYWMGEGEIIGVCTDFNLWSLHRPIEPLFFLIPPKIFPEVITLKLNTKNVSETLNFLQENWRIQFPDYPFEYYFLDDDFNRQYYADERFNKIVFLFTGLAIFIACIGLFSLASFTIEQRTKEIGIRKVLGSTVSGIVILLSREFIYLIIFAALISWPITHFLIERWLQNFAFRIEINYLVFVFSCMLIILISLLTIGVKSIKASLTNPVNVLRCE